jgi:hypothetical protein
VLRTQGALRFVSMRGMGVEVPEEEIEAILIYKGRSTAGKGFTLVRWPDDASAASC